MSQKRPKSKDDTLLLSQKVKRLEHEKAVLRGQVKILNAELTKSKHPIQQLKDLYSTIDSKIFRLINRRGYARKSRKTIRLVEVERYSEKATLEDLFAIAQSYDVVNAFNYNTRKARMKLGYRVAGRMYRLGRDSAIAAVRASYRGVRVLRGARP